MLREAVTPVFSKPDSRAEDSIRSGRDARKSRPEACATWRAIG